jgi:hypothetical protein
MSTSDIDAHRGVKGERGVIKDPPLGKYLKKLVYKNSIEPWKRVLNKTAVTIRNRLK